MNNNEKLIEEAAKAMADGEHNPLGWRGHSDDEKDWYRKDAAIALAVFEKAHTPTDAPTQTSPELEPEDDAPSRVVPTDDEREALLSAIINAPESGDALHVAEAERVRDAVLAAGFRRSGGTQ